VDDELSSFEHILLDAHLAVCPACRRFADDVRWQTDSLRAAAAEPLSRSLTVPARHSWRRTMLGVSTAAVAAAASVIALAVGLRGPSHSPAQSPRLGRADTTLSSTGETSGLPRPGLLNVDQNAGTLRGAPHA
jgi:hypothetical protein